MTPEQAFEHFQNYAKEHGVQIYALDTTDETKKLVKDLVEKGGHSENKEQLGSATPFVTDKCLVLCSVPHSFDNCNKDKPSVTSKISSSLKQVRVKLHSHRGVLSEHVPILIIGCSSRVVKPIAETFKSNPIIHLGKDNNYQRSILSVSINDGKQQAIGILNYHYMKGKISQPKPQFVDSNGTFHDINKILTIPHSPSHRLSVDHGQFMAASAGAAMQEPGLSTAAGAGSVGYGRCTPPQDPQPLLGVGGPNLLSPFPVRPGPAGLEHSERRPSFDTLAAIVANNMEPPSGYFDAVAPDDSQDPMSRVPTPEAMQRVLAAMMPLGDYVPPNRPGSIDGGVDVPEVETGSLHQEGQQGKKPEPRRPPI